MNTNMNTFIYEHLFAYLFASLIVVCDDYKYWLWNIYLFVLVYIMLIMHLVLIYMYACLCVTIDIDANTWYLFDCHLSVLQVLKVNVIAWGRLVIVSYFIGMHFSHYILFKIAISVNSSA